MNPRVFVLSASLATLLCACVNIAVASYYLSNQQFIEAAISAISTPSPAPSFAAPSPTATPEPRTQQPVAPTVVPPGVTPVATKGTPGLIEQWGANATASSEFTNAQFSASQVAGPPNTTKCGDQETAWASGKKQQPEWIEVTFDKAVNATKVVVYETYWTGNVVQIDLRDTDGNLHTVFKGDDQTTACPGQFSPPFSQTSYKANAVRLYIVDPAEKEGYAEIDAVQLVGIE